MLKPLEKLAAWSSILPPPADCEVVWAVVSVFRGTLFFLTSLFCHLRIMRTVNWSAPVNKVAATSLPLHRPWSCPRSWSRERVWNLHLTEGDKFQTLLGLHSKKGDTYSALKNGPSWSVTKVPTSPSLHFAQGQWDLGLEVPRYSKNRASGTESGWSHVGLALGTPKKEDILKVCTGRHLIINEEISCRDYIT